MGSRGMPSFIPQSCGGLLHARSFTGCSRGELFLSAEEHEELIETMLLEPDAPPCDVVLSGNDRKRPVAWEDADVLRRSLRRRGNLTAIVAEAESHSQKNAALTLHLSKSAFSREKDLLRLRIFNGKPNNCKTFILHVVPEEKDNYCYHGWRREEQERYLSAMTVRLNEYKKARRTRWCQVLNMSSRFERKGNGRRLYLEAEGLLRTCDCIDVIVLYPVDETAEQFWRSCGFHLSIDKQGSLLPVEDLDHKAGGKLIPYWRGEGEFAQLLPRWEKRIDGVCQVKMEDCERQ